MTKREFYEAVRASEVSEEITEFAKHELDMLDKRNAKRSSKPTAKQKENEAIKAKIVEFVTGCGGAVASEIGAKLEISTQKASALCRQLVTEGKFEVAEVKIAKKGKQKRYTLA